jgi:hypothetical protein
MSSRLVSTLTAPRNIAADLHVTYVVVSDRELDRYTAYTLRSATGDNLTALDRMSLRTVCNDSTDDITSRLTPRERAIVNKAIRAYHAAHDAAQLDLGAEASDRDVRNAALTVLAV